MSRDFTLGEKDDCSNSLHLPRPLAESFSFQVFLLEGENPPGRSPQSLDAPRSMTVTEALPAASAAAAAMPDFVTRVEGTERDHITEEIIAESCDRLCEND